MKFSKEMGRFIVRPTIMLIVFLLLAVVLIHPDSPFSFDLEAVRSRVDTMGNVGPLYYILVVVILELFSFPMVPLIMLAGLLFGKVGGPAAALAAATCSALVSWFIARFLIPETLRKRIFKRLGSFTPFLLQKGILHVALSRSLPVPFGIVSYATGIIYVDIKPIVLGNIIGMAPWCFIYTWLGANLFENRWIIIGVILLIILLLEILLFTYWKRQETRGLHYTDPGIQSGK